MRKAYGFRTFRITETSLFMLPEPKARPTIGSYECYDFRAMGHSRLVGIQSLTSEIRIRPPQRQYKSWTN